jgi:hypothetical protein
VTPQTKDRRSLWKVSGGQKGKNVSILDHERVAEQDRFDESYSGNSLTTGYTVGGRELAPCQVPTATHPTPGMFPLDPEENDVYSRAALKVECARLRDLCPGASVMVDKRYGAFGSDIGSLDDVLWVVTIHHNKVMGRCRADCSTTTLRDACDAALADYRAKTLDAVATSAEGRAA